MFHLQWGKPANAADPLPAHWNPHGRIATSEDVFPEELRIGPWPLGRR